MYVHIEFVLSSYLNSSVSGTLEESNLALRNNLKQNRNFYCSLRDELEQALADPAYSWVNALESNEIAFFNDESAARAYAEARLWTPYFGE